MSLADLQASLQRDILEGRRDMLPRLKLPEGSTPEKRLGVYQHAYSARLLEILGEDYDTTWSFVGDDLFHSLARAYLEQHPSQHPNVRWFSDAFPDFVATHPAAQTCPAIPEIAAFERALARAFDAANTPLAELAILGTIPLEAIDNTVFTLHPSAEVLRLTTNAYDLFRALRDEQTPPPWARLTETAHAVIWRHDLTCKHALLSSEEGMLLEQLSLGQSFGKLCELSATMADPDTTVARMAGYLQSWITQGMIGTIRH